MLLKCPMKLSFPCVSIRCCSLLSFELVISSLMQFSNMHALVRTILNTSGSLCEDLQRSLFSGNSCHDLPILSFISSTWESAGFHIGSTTCAVAWKLFKTVRWNNIKLSLFVYHLSGGGRDHCPSLCNVLGLENHSSIYFIVSFQLFQLGRVCLSLYYSILARRKSQIQLLNIYSENPACLSKVLLILVECPKRFEFTQESLSPADFSGHNMVLTHSQDQEWQLLILLLNHSNHKWKKGR